jgi:hypothetical protein
MIRLTRPGRSARLASLGSAASQGYRRPIASCRDAPSPQSVDGRIDHPTWLKVVVDGELSRDYFRVLTLPADASAIEADAALTRSSSCRQDRREQHDTLILEHTCQCM